MAGHVVLKMRERRYSGGGGSPKVEYYLGFTPTIQHEGGNVYYGTFTKSGLPMTLKTFTCIFDDVPEGNYVVSNGATHSPSTRVLTVRNGQTTEVEF
jgi:hypothetical protein